MGPRRLLTLATLTATVALSASAGAEIIGATTAVQPETMQTPDGATMRALLAGDTINLLDLIQTDDSGLAVILFADESTLSVGPGSEVFIDEFIYDGQGGSLSMELGGVARYIGGRISKEEDVEIETQHGTVGIRGGMVLVEAYQATWAAQQFGIMTCTGGGQQEVITSPNFGCIIDADGVTVIPIPKDKYDTLLRIMAGEGGVEDDGITSLVDLFCDSDFAENHKDCQAPPGGLAHTEGEDLGIPGEAEDESDVYDETQEEAVPEVEDQMGDDFPDDDFPDDDFPDDDFPDDDMPDDDEIPDDEVNCDQNPDLPQCNL